MNKKVIYFFYFFFNLLFSSLQFNDLSQIQKYDTTSQLQALIQKRETLFQENLLTENNNENLKEKAYQLINFLDYHKNTIAYNYFFMRKNGFIDLCETFLRPKKFDLAESELGHQEIITPRLEHFKTDILPTITLFSEKYNKHKNHIINNVISPGDKVYPNKKGNCNTLSLYTSLQNYFLFDSAIKPFICIGTINANSIIKPVGAIFYKYCAYLYLQKTVENFHTIPLIIYSSEKNILKIIAESFCEIFEYRDFTGNNIIFANHIDELEPILEKIKKQNYLVIENNSELFNKEKFIEKNSKKLFLTQKIFLKKILSILDQSKYNEFIYDHFYNTFFSNNYFLLFEEKINLINFIFNELILDQKINKLLLPLFNNYLFNDFLFFKSEKKYDLTVENNLILEYFKAKYNEKKFNIALPREIQEKISDENKKNKLSKISNNFNNFEKRVLQNSFNQIKTTSYDPVKNKNILSKFIGNYNNFEKRALNNSFNEIKTISNKKKLQRKVLLKHIKLGTVALITSIGIGYTIRSITNKIKFNFLK